MKLPDLPQKKYFFPSEFQELETRNVGLYYTLPVSFQGLGLEALSWLP